MVTKGWPVSVMYLSHVNYSGHRAVSVMYLSNVSYNGNLDPLVFIVLE